MAFIKITADGLYPLNNDMNTESTTIYVGDIPEGTTISVGHLDPDGNWNPFPDATLISHTPLSISHGHDVMLIALAANITAELTLETRKKGGVFNRNAAIERGKEIVDYFLTKVGKVFTNLVGTYVSSAILTSTEALTSEGQRFNQHFDVTLNGGETRYFLYELPPEADITVGLQDRTFKSFNGACNIRILWDSTGYSTVESNTVFSEYNKYEGTNQFSVSEITEPTNLGTQREVDFLIGTGVGSNSSGAVSAIRGYRLYEPGTFFIAEITNLESSDNRVLLSYSWIEIPQSLLSL